MRTAEEYHEGLIAAMDVTMNEYTPGEPSDPLVRFAAYLTGYFRDELDDLWRYAHPEDYKDEAPSEKGGAKMYEFFRRIICRVCLRTYERHPLTGVITCFLHPSEAELHR